jgi:chromosome segregation ATPase
MTEMYETCSQDIYAHRSRQEELALHVEELVSQLQSESAAREQAEAESKRLGETYTNARFSLQLEMDRLKGDMEKLHAENRDLQTQLGVQTQAKLNVAEKLGDMEKLHADNRDLQSQLSVQTQARLNVAEKLDVVLGNLKDREEELGALKKRLNELEGRLEKDQRMLIGQESQYRDQVTERNTLLLTIYQYLDKIVGVDKTPVSIFFFLFFSSCLDHNFFLFSEKKWPS